MGILKGNVDLVQFSSVAQLQPHWFQHVRLPSPSPTLRAYLNSCPSCWWCHPTISSSVIPFFSCLQYFSASGSFPMVSSSHQVANILEFQLQHQSFQWLDWFPLGLTGGISLQFKGLSRVFLNTTDQKHHPSALSSLYSPTLTSIHEYCKKTALTRWTFVGKVVFLIFNMLSMLVIAFLPRSTCILISWWQSSSTVIWGPRK